MLRNVLYNVVYVEQVKLKSLGGRTCRVGRSSSTTPSSAPRWRSTSRRPFANPTRSSRTTSSWWTSPVNRVVDWDCGAYRVRLNATDPDGSFIFGNDSRPAPPTATRASPRSRRQVCSRRTGFSSAARPSSPAEASAVAHLPRPRRETLSAGASVWIAPSPSRVSTRGPPVRPRTWAPWSRGVRHRSRSAARRR